jgi:hypothetical protein
LNSLPKYVVSSTLTDPAWNNTTVLHGDAIDAVSKLKQDVNGEIVVAGSIRLVRTLFDHDLVDELRLLVYPVVLGAGERLFGETSDKKPMRLVDTDTGDGVAFSPTSSSATPKDEFAGTGDSNPRHADHDSRPPARRGRLVAMKNGAWKNVRIERHRVAVPLSGKLELDVDPARRRGHVLAGSLPG